MNDEIKNDIKQAEKYEIDNSGNAIIYSNISTDFLCPYAISGQERISSEFSSFLEVNAKQVPLKYNLHLRLKQSQALSEDEKDRVKFAIKNDFAEKIVSIKTALKSSMTYSIIMMVLGILMIFVIVLNNAYGVGILKEILTIVDWVFIWNAVDTYFFKYVGQKANLRNYERLLASTIEFV
ncbi:MAG: hypothetical protein ACI4TX_04760 [Christensenellales bacterium]